MSYPSVTCLWSSLLISSQYTYSGWFQIIRKCRSFVRKRKREQFRIDRQITSFKLGQTKDLPNFDWQAAHVAVNRGGTVSPSIWWTDLISTWNLFNLSWLSEILYFYEYLSIVTDVGSYMLDIMLIYEKRFRRFSVQMNFGIFVLQTNFDHQTEPLLLSANGLFTLVSGICLNRLHN